MLLHQRGSPRIFADCTYIRALLSLLFLRPAGLWFYLKQGFSTWWQDGPWQFQTRVVLRVYYPRKGDLCSPGVHTSRRMGALCLALPGWTVKEERGMGAMTGKAWLYPYPPLIVTRESHSIRKGHFSKKQKALVETKQQRSNREMSAWIFCGKPGYAETDHPG